MPIKKVFDSEMAISFYSFGTEANPFDNISSVTFC